MLVGGIVSGSFCDRTGRRPTLLLGLGINSLAGLASALSPNVAALCLFRFLAGLGIGAILSSLITLATELSPPSRRGLFITFVASFWTLGSIYTALAALILMGTYGLNWRALSVAAAFPCAVGGAMVWAIVPESARFLALRGRYEEAAAAANRVADGMGYQGPPIEAEEVRHHFSAMEGVANPPIVPFTLSRMQSCLRYTKEAAAGIRHLYSRDLCLRSTLPLQVIWFSMSFGSGLCTWITQIFESVGVGNVYVSSLIFAIANIPGNMAASVLMDRLGRKALLVLSMTFASLSLLAFAHGARQGAEGGNGSQILISACFFHCFLVMGWCAISCMTSELFPTSVRSTGMGVCAASGRVAAMMAQFVNGALIERPSVLLTVASTAIMMGAFGPVLFRTKETAKIHLHDRRQHGSGAGGALNRHTTEGDRKEDSIEFKRSKGLEFA